MIDNQIRIKTNEMANILGGCMRISLKGVPHIIVQLKNMVVSVCYFGSTNIWRVFYPYPMAKQTKVTCKTDDAVIACIKKLRRVRKFKKSGLI